MVKQSKKMKGRKRGTRRNKLTPLIIGKIHAVGCGHCQILAPIWTHMKSDINKISMNNIEIDFIEMEQSEIPTKTSRFRKKYPKSVVPEVQQGYPTIFKGYGNKIYYYDQNYKDEAAMKTWMLTIPTTGGCGDAKCGLSI